MRTLEVWYPDWPVVAAGVAADVPAAVVVANRVVAVSPAARAAGVVVGLRRREAQGRCPEVAIVAADPVRDARLWEPVVAAVEAFAPGVEVSAPGAVGLGTRGPSRYFGGDQALAGKVAAAVDVAAAPVAAGHPGCRVGVADGRFAAALAAVQGPDQGPVQGPDQGPDRCTVVPPGHSPAWLAPLPVATLGRPALADLLVRLGVRTLGQLAELPTESVLGRFGPDGAEALRLARGLDERSLSARTPPPDLAVTAELDPPVDRVDRAAFVARSLADRLHGGLADLGLACTRVAIEAETDHGEHLVRLWRHNGALDAVAVAERVRWQLDAWLGEGGTTAGLILLRLVPDEVRPDHGRQLGFWGGEAAVDERVARSLTRVQGLLGPTAVVTAVVGGGRDSAEQVQLIPWGTPRGPRHPGSSLSPGLNPGPSPVPQPAPSPSPGAPSRPVRTTMGSSAHEVPPWPGHLPGPAPAVVHVTPRPARVRDAVGCPVGVTGRGVLSAPPAELAIDRDGWMAVTAWAGPWPVEERWWDGGGRRRARFQMEVVTGAAHLVVREDGQWWVEATYD
ncbi:MAG: DNA polymerase Y family protein [Actinomycetota bacterium]|nr:DNA polymerase Y family protein [Actinomycetota bacterium]